ncbi:MAG: putative metal-binding motif-containing protein, partial [Deltaproteobacteria bacterium]|nr:putative metal-binding motif-containing protein [Deltaproteobacteria bacterium]
AVAYDLVYDLLDGATRQGVVAHLEQCGTLLYDAVQGGSVEARTADVIAAYAGLGLLALAIQDESSHPDLEQWLAVAVQQLGTAACFDGWNPGGGFDEGYYGSLWGSPEALRFFEAYRRETNDDLLSGTNLEQAASWYVYGWLPHGSHPSWGTGYLTGGHAFSGEHLISIERSDDRLGKWGWQQVHGLTGVELLSRPVPVSDLLAVALWYPTELADITDPLLAGYPPDRWFHDTQNPADGWGGTDRGQGGSVIFRNGWRSESVVLGFKVSDEWQPRSHNDSSSFILSAHEVEMVTDTPGAAYDDRNDHSVVLLGTHNDGAAKRTSYRGAIHEIFSAEWVGYGSADGRYPAGDHEAGDEEDPTDDLWEPVERADRAVALVRGPRPYVLVADDVSGDGTTAMASTWLLQLGTQAWGVSSGSGMPNNPLRVEFNSGQQLLVTLVAPSMPQVAVDWHPDSFSHLQVAATMAPTIRGQFLALLQPQWFFGAAEEPAIVPLAVTNGVGAEIYWSNGYDRVLFRHGAVVSTSDGTWSDARLAMVRWDQGMGLSSWLAAEATQLVVGPVGLYDSGGLSSSAALSHDRLDLQAAEQPAPLQIAAYGPSIDEVWLNGALVSHVRVGDYVLVPAECSDTERCNGVDDDCDGQVDEDDAEDAGLWYLDDDDDGYGDDETVVQACQPPKDYVGEGGDCDDDQDDVYPTAPEKCFDAEDNDCDGWVDEADPDCARTLPAQDDSTICTCRGAPGSRQAPPLSWLALALIALVRRRRGRAGSYCTSKAPRSQGSARGRPR